MSRPLPPYVDLDRAYQRPDTGKPSQLGWWHQVAHNLDQLWYSYDVGAGLESGAISEPLVPWSGLTSTSSSQRFLHNRVGEIAYVWATSDFTTIGGTQAGCGLPYPAAELAATMVVGRGVVTETASSRSWGVAVTLAPDATSVLLWLGNEALTSAGGIGSSTIAVQFTYRIDRPTDGLVSGRSSIHDHRGPL